MTTIKDATPAAGSLEVALDLILNQRTLVLATCDQTAPWTAPVFFVYANKGFCFFSSPRSAHIGHIQAGSTVAASIFSDKGQWRQIRGLQMRGTVYRLRKVSERLKVTGGFIRKFPFAREFLQGGPGSVPDLSRRVQIYSFLPSEIYLVDNSTAFGRRLPLEIVLLESAAQKEG